MKKIFFLFFVLLFLFCPLVHSELSDNFTEQSMQAAENKANMQQKEFDIDELIENADVPDQMPVSRDLPWYLDAIQKPATRMLLLVCSVWDWFKTKTDRVLYSSNHVRKLNHEHETPST